MPDEYPEDDFLANNPPAPASPDGTRIDEMNHFGMFALVALMFGTVILLVGILVGADIRSNAEGDVSMGPVDSSITIEIVEASDPAPAPLEWFGPFLVEEFPINEDPTGPAFDYNALAYEDGYRDGYNHAEDVINFGAIPPDELFVYDEYTEGRRDGFNDAFVDYTGSVYEDWEVNVFGGLTYDRCWSFGYSAGQADASFDYFDAPILGSNASECELGLIEGYHVGYDDYYMVTSIPETECDRGTWDGEAAAYEDSYNAVYRSHGGFGVSSEYVNCWRESYAMTWEFGFVPHDYDPITYEETLREFFCFGGAEYAWPTDVDFEVLLIIPEGIDHMHYDIDDLFDHAHLNATDGFVELNLAQLGRSTGYIDFIVDPHGANSSLCSFEFIGGES